ncbi:MAG: DegQ family serine endoprotease [Calditerrivibrio sp.]|nr:DegQ family serine endoprotease [Calditerrivibrio sp.]MCA1980056.1 DegQ family serine endoprotease [Calditerrivibrio sp.]
MKNIIILLLFVVAIVLGYQFYGKEISAKYNDYFKKKEEVNLEKLNTSSETVLKPSEQILSVQESFEKVAESVLPSVVNIYTEQKIKARPQFNLPFGDNPLFRDFFNDFFGTPKNREYKSSSLGSGFIITDTGYIVTNEHVIRDADSISVKLSDKRSFKAKLVGSDPKTDVAVIKIESENLKPLKFGDSSKLKTGQWSIAVGNPFGLNGTLTVGVISATGRSGLGIETYEDFIQTDASINPGNSGGPLLNIYGEVVGINTAIIASGQGIGFAIPANMAKPIIEQIINKGTVERSWIGVGIQDLSPELARSMGVKVEHGVVVNKVYDKSPASKSGLMEGDIILECNNTKITSASDLQKIVVNSKIGTKIDCKILRDNKEIKVGIITEKMPEDATSQKNSSMEFLEEKLGITVRDFTEEDSGSFNHKNGVIILRVEQGSVGEIIGLQEGDLIISVNRKSIKNVNEFKRIMANFSKGSIINLMIEREGDTFFVAARLR